MSDEHHHPDRCGRRGSIDSAPTADAEPCVSPSGNDWGNPDFDPNFPNNAQFLAAVRATGISDHRLAALIAAGQLEVPIAEAIPLDEVQRAYRILERRHTRGKIVLRS
jgi:hypothetical protein